MPSDVLTVQSPQSILKRNVKVDVTGIFKGISDVAASHAKHELAGALKGAASVFGAVRLESLAPGEIAWQLIYRALERAVRALIGEAAPDADDEPRLLKEHLDWTTAPEQLQQLTLDHSLFEKPAQLPLLGHAKVPLKSWLGDFGVPAARIPAIADRLPGYFVEALFVEWLARPEEYKPVVQALQAPPFDATQRELRWRAYRGWLQKQVDEAVFDEPFGLQQIYILPRAYWIKRTPSQDRDERKEESRHVVDLTEELDAWVGVAARNDPIRFVHGDPGSGKSSFAKIFAARHAELGRKVVLAPMQWLDASEEVEATIGEYLRETSQMADNPLDGKDERVLLILDGLDELSMQGKLAEGAAREFVAKLERLVDLRNHKECRLQAVVTGRPLAIQAAAGQKPERRVLYMVPYFVREEARKEYVDPKRLLAEDQRQRWWRDYGAASGTHLADMPQELAREDLEEVTAQPLLNYLVALSRRRQKVDFNKEVNVNNIYDDLIRAVHERAYERREHIAIKGLLFDHFVRILEEIALAAWHGDGRTTTIGEIEKACERGQLTSLLRQFEADSKTGVIRLLTAFYFRQHGSRRDEWTFEFTHKSFGEYLIARRLVRAVARINKERREAAEAPGEGWSEKEALKLWAQLCGPSPLSRDLLKLLFNEVATRESDEVEPWQRTFVELMQYTVRVGLPMEELPEVPLFGMKMRHSRNAEEALLAVHAACAGVTDRCIEMQWSEPESAAEWFSRLLGPYFGTAVVGQCMAALGLANTTWVARFLEFADFSGADLSGADLSGANLRVANLSYANLRVANLSHANLRVANLRVANLSGANLSGANLSGANLSGADLSHADLSNARLVRATLVRANLTSADLIDADLIDADLSGTNLRDADLRDADLSGANLRDADLRDADLSGADLTAANLRGAEFSGASLRNADLRGSNYFDALNANFDGAILNDSDEPEVESD